MLQDSSGVLQLHLQTCRLHPHIGLVAGVCIDAPASAPYEVTRPRAPAIAFASPQYQPPVASQLLRPHSPSSHSKPCKDATPSDAFTRPAAPAHAFGRPSRPPNDSVTSLDAYYAHSGVIPLDFRWHGGTDDAGARGPGSYDTCSTSSALSRHRKAPGAAWGRHSGSSKLSRTRGVSMLLGRLDGDRGSCHDSVGSGQWKYDRVDAGRAKDALGSRPKGTVRWTRPDNVRRGAATMPDAPAATLLAPRYAVVERRAPGVSFGGAPHQLGSGTARAQRPMRLSARSENADTGTAGAPEQSPTEAAQYQARTAPSQRSLSDSVLPPEHTHADAAALVLPRHPAWAFRPLPLPPACGKKLDDTVEEAAAGKGRVTKSIELNPDPLPLRPRLTTGAVTFMLPARRAALSPRAFQDVAKCPACNRSRASPTLLRVPLAQMLECAEQVVLRAELRPAPQLPSRSRSQTWPTRCGRGRSCSVTPRV